MVIVLLFVLLNQMFFCLFLRGDNLVVTGAVRDIESVFQTSISVWKHRKSGRALFKSNANSGKIRKQQIVCKFYLTTRFKFLLRFALLLSPLLVFRSFL